MNILYLSIPLLTPYQGIDYQTDCLLTGLKDLFGSSVVDFNRQNHLYKSFPEQYTPGMYGSGFTVTRVIDEDEADRKNITEKIKKQFYDLIIYGSIHRYNEYLDEILQYYPTNRVVAVDGEDILDIHPSYKKGILYFKRQLMEPPSKEKRMFPIHFAMPTNNRATFRTDKIKDYSYITPLDLNTYVYRGNEKGYYNDYQEARFGVTKCKAGWDCMRHYEIISNGCLPHFLDIEDCPDFIMTTFPKKLCRTINRELNNNVSKEKIYADHIDEMKDHYYNNLLTKHLAKYFCETVFNMKTE